MLASRFYGADIGLTVTFKRAMQWKTQRYANARELTITVIR